MTPQNSKLKANEATCISHKHFSTRRANQSILKKISPEYSLEGLMLKLKLQYFGHLIQRTDSLGKTLILGRLKVEEGDNRGCHDLRFLNVEFKANSFTLLFHFHEEAL